MGARRTRVRLHAYHLGGNSSAVALTDETGPGHPRAMLGGARAGTRFLRGPSRHAGDEAHLAHVEPSVALGHGPARKQQRHRIDVHALAVAHLIVDVGARGMPGAAEVAKLVALIQHLAHPRRDALQVTVEVGPTVDVLRDHGIAITTAPFGKHHLLLRSRCPHWRAELAA